MERKIKVGIVGLGRLGRSGGGGGGATKLPEKFIVAAAADHDPERLKNLPEEFKNAKLFGSLDEMLEKGDIEVVAIVTRHPAHVPMAIQALRAGKYVYLEKPTATSLAEFDSLEPYRDRIFFGHNRRYEAAFQKALRLIARGELGTIQMIKLYRSVGYCRRNDWMTMTEFYGGLLSNWGPHLIDQALQFLDSPVRDIWADVRSIISIGDGDDFFKILLKAENGRAADIEVTGANTMPGREMEIIGDRGTLVWPVDGKMLVRRIDPEIELKPLKPHPENPPFKYGNFDETLSFVESKYDVPDICPVELWNRVWDTLVNRAPYPITWEQAREVVRVTEEVFRRSDFAPIKKFRSSKA